MAIIVDAGLEITIVVSNEVGEVERGWLPWSMMQVVVVAP